MGRGRKASFPIRQAQGRPFRLAQDRLSAPLRWVRNDDESGTCGQLPVIVGALFGPLALLAMIRLPARASGDGYRIDAQRRAWERIRANQRDTDMWS